MEKYNLSAISPSIVGCTWHVINGEMSTHAEYGGRSTRHCLVRPSSIETFCQVFTQASWQCFYSFLHARGGCGWGLDFCFAHYCAHQAATLAVDYNMVGYHLEFPSAESRQLSWFNDTHRALVTAGTNLTFPAIQRHVDMDFYAKQRLGHAYNLYVAQRYNCPESNNSLVGIWSCPNDGDDKKE